MLPVCGAKKKDSEPRVRTGVQHVKEPCTFQTEWQASGEGFKRQKHQLAAPGPYNRSRYLLMMQQPQAVTALQNRPISSPLGQTSCLPLNACHFVMHDICFIALTVEQQQQH